MLNMNTEIDVKELITSLLSGKSSQSCRLCLKQANSYCTLEDHVHLGSQYTGSCSTMADVLTELFSSGNEMPWSDQDSLCEFCARSAIDCFLFMEMCRDSEKQLHSILNTIVDCLNPTDKELSEAKAMYLLLDGNAPKVIIDQESCTQSPKFVKKRVKSLLTYRNHQRKKGKNGKIKRITFDCDLCGESYRNTNVECKMVFCKECDKSFHSNVSFRRHMASVHFERNIKCPQCPKLFNSHTLLQRHKRDDHQELMCPHCGKTYDKKRSLLVHMESHVLKSCEKCGKNFKHDKTLQSHRHFCVYGFKVEQELHTCNICNKSYARKGSLLDHFRFHHTDAKSFDCQWCDKKYSCQSRLLAHVVKHTRERNFRCDICGGDFVTKEALLYHTRRHTGEKPYPCSVCDERFLSASRRMEHIRKKHLGPTLSCDFCSRKFVTQFALKTHIARHFNPNSKLYYEMKPEVM